MMALAALGSANLLHKGRGQGALYTNSTSTTPFTARTAAMRGMPLDFQEERKNN